MKTNKKGKVFYLLLLLLLTGLLLSTSTYAWFTVNRKVTVDALNVKIESGGGLEIASDAINFKASLSEDDLIDAKDTYKTSVNQLPSLIAPCSTTGNLVNGYMDMYLGTVTNNNEGDYIITTLKTIEESSNGIDAEGRFVVFDVFIKTNQERDIYLTGDSKVTYNGDTSVGTENAIRVAFIIEGNLSSGENVENIQKLSTNNQNNLYIWEPNYDTHTKMGIQNALSVYGITTSETNAQYINYDGVKSEIMESDNILLSNALESIYGDKFERVVPKIKTTKDNTENILLARFNAGITKVRIYLWLEGQDVDCENNASVGDISFNLGFTIDPS